MGKAVKAALFVPLVLLAVCAAIALLALALYLVREVWAWTVPDIFPGAVKQGLVAGSISWMTAFKLVVVAALFGGITRGASGKG